jgi:ParB family chromosome partitioning protein
LPNPKQPRSQINPETLVELADSIREYGIIEPLIVTAIPESERAQLLKTGVNAEYYLIAGERRWRAAKLAHMDKVPVLIREASEQKLLEMAIVENIQRQDLNPIEEALALSELYRNYRIKLEDLAKKIGRDISTISNKMRLLKLPEKVQNGLLMGEISESHAHLLLSLKSKDALLAAYNIISKKQLSVRDADELIRKITLANKGAGGPSKKTNAIVYDELTAKIADDLGGRLGKGFKLVRKRNGGRITIPFMSDKQLQALYDYLMSNKFSV